MLQRLKRRPGRRPIADGARRGFTLLELMLVLALMVVIAAIAWPSIKGTFASQRLRKAAEQLRAELGKTRVRAMRTGTIQTFRFQVGMGNFSSETWTASVEDVNASNATSFEAMPGSAASPTSRQDSLPEGVIFHAAEVTLDARAAKLQGGGGGAGGAADGEWSDPIFCYPDGTTSNTHIVLSNSRGQAIVVTLRGLTGLTMSGDLTSLEQLSQ
ncbi:MAG: prepilin-type N-terminal cleavage/methylation domain-containing protein [Pirellulales bacterium]